MRQQLVNSRTHADKNKMKTYQSHLMKALKYASILLVVVWCGFFLGENFKLRDRIQSDPNFEQRRANFLKEGSLDPLTWMLYFPRASSNQNP